MKHVIGKHFELVDDRKITNMDFERELVVRIGFIDKPRVLVY